MSLSNGSSVVLDSTEYLKQLKYSSKYIRNKVTQVLTELYFLGELKVYMRFPVELYCTLERP